MNTSIIRKIKLSILMVMVFAMFLPLMTTAADLVTSADQLESQLNDSSISEIKLGSDITFNYGDYFSTNVNASGNEKILDLNGYSIFVNTATGNKITLNCNISTIKIIDSTNGGNSKIKTTSPNTSSNPDVLLFQQNSSNKSVSFYIDGVDFESGRAYSYLVGGSGRFKNLTIKNSTISGIRGLFNTDNFDSVTLSNVTIKQENNSSSLLSQFSTFTVDKVIDSDSILEHVDSSSKKVKADRTTTLDKISFQYGDIVIRYPTVADISYEETYGETPQGQTISITNRTSSDLTVSDISVDNSNFEIVGDKPTISACTKDENTGACKTVNTSLKIKANEGLSAGDYTGTITVTYSDNKTDTATVTLKVKPKEITGHSITMNDWTYGDTANDAKVEGLTGLSLTDYEITYATRGTENYSDTKPSVAGNYTVKLHVTNTNYSVVDVTDDFTINRNNKEIKIVANSKSWTYDGSDHSDSGYKVYYDGGATALTDNKLPNGDIVTATVTGKVKDVKDGNINNTVGTITIKNGNVDVTACYSNIVTTAGTLTINKKDSKIKVTSEGAEREYNGQPLTNDNYTTSGAVVDGDEIKVDITGTQTYAGESDNTFTVKVTRGTDDVTDNYTFDTHSYGKLKVTPASQVLTVADQSVIITNSITLEELKKAVSGEQCTKDELSFDISSGTGLTFDPESDSFIASSDTGEVTMTVTAAAKDIDGDSTPEYSKATKEFKINIIDKTVVTISGLTNNQVFTYDGETHTPEGMITVQDNKVSVSELDISYIGTGTTTYEETATPPSDAGTYTITYKVKDNNSTYKGSVSYNFTIKKAQLTKPSLAESQKSFVYTGQDITPKITVIDSEDALINKTGGLTGKNVGDYTITVSLKDKNNYEWKDDSTTDDVTLGWKITKATVTAIPSLLESSFEYNGQNITPEISNFDGKLEEKDGDLTKKDAGNNYSITIKLKDKVNYMWSDGTTNDITLSWSITKAKVTIPTLAGNTFVYTSEGNGYKPTINNENSDLIDYSGDIEYKKDVANYSITAKLKDTSNYMWDDNSSSSITLKWSITKAPATKPTLAQISYEYSGSNITPVFNGFDDTLMQKTNDVNKINAGNYSITIGLIDKNNYAWTDGTTGDFAINWSITKASVTKPTLDENSFEYTGQEITLPTLSNYDEDIMSIVNDSNKGTIVGDYFVQVSLDDVNNYKWTDEESDSITIEWYIVPATSKIIETESTSIYYKNNGGTATIKASGVMKDFVELKIYKDDTLGYEEVDASNYTVSSGSTIIVLKESYLQTLDYDKDYKFMLVYNNNYTETYPVHILKVRKYVAPSSSSDDSTSTVVKKVVNTSSH